MGEHRSMPSASDGLWAIWIAGWTGAEGDRPGEFSCRISGYEEGHFPITIRLLGELRCVAIGTYCYLGLAAALVVQRGYGEPLFAFSEEASPETVELTTVATRTELTRAAWPTGLTTSCQSPSRHCAARSQAVERVEIRRCTAATGVGGRTSSCKTGVISLVQPDGSVTDTRLGCKVEAELAAILGGLERLQRSPIGEYDLAEKMHRFRLNPPLTEDEVARFEAAHGIALPGDYRAFLTQLGNGGAGPAYGVSKLGEAPLGWEPRPFREIEGYVGCLSKPFPHTAAWNDYRDTAKYEGPIDGAIPISDIGCGSMFWLVVAGPEAGHIWCDSRADYAGLAPMPDDASRKTFLEWYLDWLHKELAKRVQGAI